MCGIAGGFLKNKVADIDFIENILSNIRHRGPDGEGVFIEKSTYLAHTRLSIIDLSSNASQPFIKNFEGSKVVSVHNGEIYNYKELKAQYLNKYLEKFTGNSDSEIVPFLYKEIKLEFANVLRGMFAIAIYDSARKTITISRDLFGIKPLYYVHNETGFHFASEIKVLLDFINQENLNFQGIRDFIGLGFIPEPGTIYSEIKCVNPGESIIYDIDTDRITSKENQTLKIEFNEKKTSLNEIETYVKEAVRKQLISDVKLGSLLSGGVDSTLIALIAAQEINKISTYNVRFNDEQRDESRIAYETSKSLHTEHTELKFPDSITIDELNQLLKHMDQPFGDMSILPTFRVMQQVSKHSKVVLSGDGGDEFACGYPRFIQFETILFLKRILPKTIISLLRVVNRKLLKSRRINKLLEFALLSEIEIICGLNSYINENVKAKWLNPDFFYSTSRTAELYKNIFSNDLTNCQNMSLVLYKTSLLSKMLRKVDMMSMLANVEVRVPLLDESLVNKLLHLECSSKFNSVKNKIPFRKIIKKYLPMYTNNQKIGFDLGRKEKSFVNILDVMKTKIFDSYKSIMWKYLNRDEILKFMGSSDFDISQDSRNQIIVNLYSLHYWFERNSK